MKNQHTIHLLELSLATLFISTSGVLGRFIAMPTPVIIWWRCSLGLLFLYIFCRYKKIDLRINTKKDIATFIISALFLGAHWITYFHALKLSNVALGMLSLYTFPVITALLEPLFIKAKFDPIHVILGLVVLVGIYILAPEFDLENSHIKGILFGLLSALFYSIRILILKQHVRNYNGTMLMLHQLFILSFALLPVLFFMDTSGIRTQFPYVIILALVTTAIGHTLFIRSLKYFSATAASIISSALPIYGIILAYIFLREIPSLNTFLGGLLIVGTVFIEAARSKKKS